MVVRKGWAGLPWQLAWSEQPGRDGCYCRITASDLPGIFVLSRSRADIALIGLAVMGQNLILNMNDHGFVVSEETNCLGRLTSSTWDWS